MSHKLISLVKKFKVSNIGKERILIPKHLKVQSFGWKVKAKGVRGEKQIIFPPFWQLLMHRGGLELKAPNNVNSALYGSLHQKLDKLVWGVAIGYKQRLNFVGTGYRARLEQNLLILRLGYFYERKLELPTNSKIECVKPNLLEITGLDYNEIRQYAYKIRGSRPPDPYKGKGIRLEKEEVHLKEGKKSLK